MGEQLAALAPSRLKARWLEVEANRLSKEAFLAEEADALARYRRLWNEALPLPGAESLEESILSEVARWRGTSDLALTRRRCEAALAALKARWLATVDAARSKETIIAYYDQSQELIEELMWWHALIDDTSPLAYVAALDFARAHGCRDLLDFGSGVGAGAILFRPHCRIVALADVSSTLLAFCRWRLEARGMDAKLIDLKQAKLPARTYDFVTAMDVFEHLDDPASAIDAIDAALVPGGYIYGRFDCEPEDADRPQHILSDFVGVFEHFRRRGFTEVWKDEWFWGHQVFRKAG
ncbi:MAG: class I SAM-dependent methyltransferase [Proteobacteria bacterium]|nr:class I SAM-dependent methyltransferase [Pseudomonadota bacterium]MBI3498005.1 class I SAM-dependent methyltransferase [Pseudomonadota bacterium]